MKKNDSTSPGFPANFKENSDVACINLCISQIVLFIYPEDKLSHF